MKTIWKFTFSVADSFTVSMPAGAEFLHVAMQRDLSCMWLSVDDQAFQVLRRFAVQGTGRLLGEARREDVRYLGTFQNGPFVWHLFDLGEEEQKNGN